MKHWARWCAAVAAGCWVAPLVGQGSAGAVSPHTTVTSDMLLNAQQSGDWLMYGGNYWNNRYSPLTTINTTNVKHLVPRWVLQTGTEKLGSLETTPIVVNGVIYFTSAVAPNNVVIAQDLRSGKQLWRYEHKTDPKSFGVACCGPNNRGVAIANGMVFLGTLDGMLVAIDQATGAEKWAVPVGDPGMGYTETMAPLVIGDNAPADPWPASGVTSRDPAATAAHHRAPLLIPTSIEGPPISFSALGAPTGPPRARGPRTGYGPAPAHNSDPAPR